MQCATQQKQHGSTVACYIKHFQCRLLPRKSGQAVPRSDGKIRLNASPKIGTSYSSALQTNYCFFAHSSILVSSTFKGIEPSFKIAL